MAKHRSYSVEFKRQVVQGYLTGETLHGIAKRHDISRNLIRIWIAKHEAGALDSDTAAASMLTECEARIAALERLVGKLTLENEFLRGPRGTLACREARARASLPAPRPLGCRRMPTNGARTIDLLRRDQGPTNRGGSAHGAHHRDLCRVPTIRLPTHNSPAAGGRDHRQPQEGHAAYEGAWPCLSVAEGCRLMGLARSTYYDEIKGQPIEEGRLMAHTTEICAEFPRYGYRRSAASSVKRTARVNRDLCRVPTIRLPTHNSPAAGGRDHRQPQEGHAAYEGAWPYRAAAAALRGHHRQRS